MVEACLSSTTSRRFLRSGSVIGRYQDMSLGKFVDGFTLASVSLGQGHLIGELGSAAVESTESLQEEATRFPSVFIALAKISHPSLCI